MADINDAGPARPMTVADLRDAPRRFVGKLTEAECASLAALFDISAVDSLSYDIVTTPWRAGVRVTGQLRGRAVQECVVTLDPVKEKIDESFDRGFLPLESLYSEDSPGAEHEIVTDSEIDEIPEPLTDPLDLAQIVAETFGIALDPYPRSKEAEEAVFSAAPPGIEPLKDADVKPFAGLAALRDKMGKTDSGE